MPEIKIWRHLMYSKTCCYPYFLQAKCLYDEPYWNAEFVDFLSYNRRRTFWLKWACYSILKKKLIYIRAPINPILHGAGHFVPRLVDYLAWRLSGRSDWAHISWLFFFQHSLCPIEAIFQKKILKIWKIEKMFFDRSNIKGSPLWKKNFENYFLPIFVANHIIST